MGDGCIGDGCIGDGCIGDGCMGEGCIGDMLAFCWLLPGLCITFDMDPGPGECETTGAGLCKGELCCIIGEADGDIMGDCDAG